MIFFFLCTLSSFKIFYCGRFNRSIRLIINTNSSVEQIKNELLRKTTVKIKKKNKVVFEEKPISINHVGINIFDITIDMMGLTGRFGFYILFNDVQLDDEVFEGRVFFNSIIDCGNFTTKFKNKAVPLRSGKNCNGFCCFK